MRSVVKTGKTVNDAVQAALQELGASLDDVTIEIMEEPKSGFLGVFGSKEAIVRVSRNESSFEDLLHEDQPHHEEVCDVTASATPISPVSAEAPLREEAVEPVKEEVISPAQPTTESEPLESVAQAKQTSETSEASHSLLDLIHQEVEREQGTQTVTVSVEKTEKIVEEAAVASTEVEEADVVTDAFEDAEESEETAGVEARVFTEIELLHFAEDWLAELLDKMHITADLEASLEDENLHMELVNITDTDMGIVIGRRAETLNAIQYLLGVTLNRASKKHYRVYLDVGGYRKRRAQNITRLAERNAEKVQRSKRSMKLEPMNAYERRIVHTALQEMEHIDTVSEGREPHRKVVILYKD